MKIERLLRIWETLTDEESEAGLLALMRQTANGPVAGAIVAYCQVNSDVEGEVLDHLQEDEG